MGAPGPALVGSWEAASSRSRRSVKGFNAEATAALRLSTGAGAATGVTADREYGVADAEGLDRCRLGGMIMIIKFQHFSQTAKATEYCKTKLTGSAKTLQNKNHYPERCTQTPAHAPRPAALD